MNHNRNPLGRPPLPELASHPEPLPPSIQERFPKAAPLGDPVPPHGLFLFAARRAKGWTHIEVAAAMGRRGVAIHPRTVMAWERGHMPRANVWMHVCAALEVHPLGCPDMYAAT